MHPGGRWGAMQNELVSQIFTGPPQVVLVSTAGVLELERRRPVDVLQELLQVRGVCCGMMLLWWCHVGVGEKKKDMGRREGEGESWVELCVCRELRHTVSERPGVSWTDTPLVCVLTCMLCACVMHAGALC